MVWRPNGELWTLLSHQALLKIRVRLVPAGRRIGGGESVGVTGRRIGGGESVGDTVKLSDRTNQSDKMAFYSSYRYQGFFLGGVFTWERWCPFEKHGVL